MEAKGSNEAGEVWGRVMRWNVALPVAVTIKYL